MSDYNDNTGQWHSAYMAKTKGMTDEELRYVIEDCHNAMHAMPSNPKCGQYADEAHYCAMELRRRTMELRHAKQKRHERIHHKFEVSAIHAKYRRVLNDIHEEAKLSLTALVRDKPHVVEDKLDRIAGMTEQLISDSLVADTKRKMEDSNA